MNEGKELRENWTPARIWKRDRLGGGGGGVELSLASLAPRPSCFALAVSLTHVAFFALKSGEAVNRLLQKVVVVHIKEVLR